jgi:large subunit ribosomal protein L29
MLNLKFGRKQNGATGYKLMARSQEKEMELAKMRNLSDEELAHQEKASGEQLFRLRFQVSMGQNDGVKKLRELRREIAQIKTIARERELGIHGAAEEAKSETPAAKAEKPAARTRAPKKKAKPVAVKKAAKPKKAKAPAKDTKKKAAKGARK